MLDPVSTLAGANEALLFALPFALFFRRTLIVLYLALGQPDFQLDAAFRVMHVERHQREAGAFGLADQLVDFRRVQQELARARGVGMDMGGRGGKRADMAADL